MVQLRVVQESADELEFDLEGTWDEVRQAQVAPEEDLEDLEESLQALERLDRSSPDLWPDHIPGVGQFLPQTPFADTDTPRGSEAGGYLHNLSR